MTLGTPWSTSIYRLIAYECGDNMGTTPQKKNEKVAFVAIKHSPLSLKNIYTHNKISPRYFPGIDDSLFAGN
jgi:hypothetical protein